MTWPDFVHLCAERTDGEEGQRTTRKYRQYADSEPHRLPSNYDPSHGDDDLRKILGGNGMRVLREAIDGTRLG